MTNSKRYKWQANWTVNDERTMATHQLGLVVRLTSEGHSVAGAESVIQQLSPKHGHNAAEMVRRMTREGLDLLSGRAKIFT